MVAVRLVLEPTTVDRSLPFQRRVLPATNPDPVAVRVVAEAPIRAEVGLMLARVGAGFWIEKVCAEDTPPPGSGLIAVMFNVPGVTSDVAGMMIVQLLPLPQEVLSGVPFTASRVMVSAKPDPVAVMVVVALPTSTCVGEIPDSTGAGVTMLRDCEALVPPPGGGMVTDTGNVPSRVNWAAETVTRSSESDMRVGTYVVPPTDTVAALWNPIPARMSIVLGLFKSTVAGVIDVRTGAGAVTLTMSAALVPPPGAGVEIVRLSVPEVARAAADSVAWSSVDELTVVAMGTPSIRRRLVGRNPVPVATMSVSALP
jgi:hypothetical protein